MNTHLREDLAGLLASSESPRLSIALPADPVTPQALTRYRNLLRAAELRAPGDDAAAPVIARARALAHDTALWQQPGRGLAIYVDARTQRAYHLPYPVTERAVVGTDFLLTPLIPLLAIDRPYAVLALSEGAVRFLRGTREAMREVSLPASVPISLKAALVNDEFEPESRYTPVATATGHKRGAIYYTHGVGSDVREKELLRYCRLIDQGLREVLTPATMPLILAGGEELIGLYRSVTSYPHLQANVIAGNPDHLSAATLHERARPLIADLENREREATIARYRALIGTGKASADPVDIARAAGEGRVETLIVAAELAAAVAPGLAIAPGEGVANRALLDTLRNGGAVAEAAPGAFPGDQEIAAIYRY
jgi:hypothetical protein